MSKKKPTQALGRAIAKDRNRARRNPRGGQQSWLHTSELDDGAQWSKQNLKSVTEENQLDEFLSTAELAGTEFTAEKLNVSVVDPSGVSATGLPGARELREMEEAEEENRPFLSIPRRPAWDASTSVDELEQRQRDSFLSWRRSLAHLEDNEHLVLTPFEKNLEFWKQLWRVLERSDVVVQIVDARNPLLFRCEDLEKYVKELDENKVNMILMSKADLLSGEQRAIWSRYFTQNCPSITVAFWSALMESEPLIGKTREGDAAPLVEGEQDGEEEEGRILDRESLLQLFLSISPVKGSGLTTVGMVGYPNVGKSSTINNLFQEKKVPVSATPGRTKHFQTLYIDDRVMLCDCPGLVFPSFISSKADMICNGVLPIDQMRDHTPPVSLVCQRIPRAVLENTYGICLPSPSEGEDPNRYPCAHELLEAYGYMRGYMTAHGTPDCSRSARYILKDYVNGKLLYCHPPPSCDDCLFNGFTQAVSEAAGVVDPNQQDSPPSTSTATGKGSAVVVSEFDKQFFRQEHSRVISKPVVRPDSGGTRQRGGAGVVDEASQSKPWKKHHNYGKKEKTRRIVNAM